MTDTTTKHDDAQSDLDEITRAVADYCEGYYRRDQGRTYRAYHPECLKRAFEETELGVFYLVSQTRASMVDVAGLSERAQEPEYSIIVDDVRGNIASVRLYSNEWVDYLHVVKTRGAWKLLHAAYDELPSEGAEVPEDDRAAVENVALDYIASWYEGDADRHAGVYHDECVKRAFREDGGLAVTSGQRMVELCAAGQGVLPGAEWEISVDDIVGNVASVRIDSTRWVDHLHIAKARGRWALFHASYTPA